jgi:hypothetical protein
MLPSGTWPFQCQALMDCLNVPHQSCGCKNSLDPENFAIVYNLKQSGEVIVSYCGNYLVLKVIDAENFAIVYNLKQSG